MDLPGPIVLIEDLPRLLPARGPVPSPGLVLVYESANGRLSAPDGGYTAGEVCWRRPRRVYAVDVTRHRLALRLRRDGGDVEVRAEWWARDPVAVVASRCADGATECYDFLADHLARHPDTGRGTLDAGRGLAVAGVELSGGADR